MPCNRQARDVAWRQPATPSRSSSPGSNLLHLQARLHDAVFDRREDVRGGEGRHLVHARARAGVGPRRPQRGAGVGEHGVDIAGDGRALDQVKVPMPAPAEMA